MNEKNIMLFSKNTDLSIHWATKLAYKRRMSMEPRTLLPDKANQSRRGCDIMKKAHAHPSTKLTCFMLQKLAVDF